MLSSSSPSFCPHPEERALARVSKDAAPGRYPDAWPWFVLREPQDARASPALLTMRLTDFMRQHTLQLFFPCAWPSSGLVSMWLQPALVAQYSHARQVSGE